MVEGVEGEVLDDQALWVEFGPLGRRDILPGERRQPVVGKLVQRRAAYENQRDGTIGRR